MTYAILLAAGRSNRMKTKEKKQFITINNKPILFYSIDKFLKLKEIEKILIVINKNDKNNKVIKLLLKKYSKYFISSKFFLIFGGKERFDSVSNALNFINKYNNISSTDKVIIHDSARPNFSIQDVNNLLLTLNKYKSVSLSYKLSDSIKKIKETDKELFEISESVDRDKYHLVSTPQGFQLKLLIECYDKFYKSTLNYKITDDLQIIEYFSKHKSYLIDSKKSNIKITTKDDLNMIKYIL